MRYTCLFQETIINVQPESQHFWGILLLVLQWVFQAVSDFTNLVEPQISFGFDLISLPWLVGYLTEFWPFTIIWDAWFEKKNNVLFILSDLDIGHTYM